MENSRKKNLLLGFKNEKSSSIFKLNYLKIIFLINLSKKLKWLFKNFTLVAIKQKWTVLERNSYTNAKMDQLLVDLII